MFPTAARAAARAASKAAPTVASATGPERPKWKLMLWTGIFTAVTVTGTIYGAGLKTQQEWKEEKKKVLEATVDEKVALLEGQRAELMRQRSEIEYKLEDLRARMRATAAAAASAAEAEGSEAKEERGRGPR